jgi:hypothetical protein
MPSMPRPLHCIPIYPHGLSSCGPFPPGKYGNPFVLTATEYLTKWAEAESFVKIEASHLIWFIMMNIFARFGVTKAFVSDNGPQFKSTKMEDFFKQFRVDHHFSSPYYPQGVRLQPLKKP